MEIYGGGSGGGEGSELQHGDATSHTQMSMSGNNCQLSQKMECVDESCYCGYFLNFFPERLKHDRCHIGDSHLAIVQTEFHVGAGAQGRKQSPADLIRTLRASVMKDPELLIFLYIMLMSQAFGGLDQRPAATEPQQRVPA